MRGTRYVISLLAASLCGASSAMADTVDNSADSTQVVALEDSVWIDSVTCDVHHLQRLGGVDTLRVMRPRPIVALVEDLTVNASILAFDYFYYDRSYSRITKNVLKDHFTHGFVWDNDSFSGNQFSHPYHGALFYNTAREHGLSYGVSLLYPLLGSATWELMCETNAPALNDLLSTGIGGSAFGEVTHRASDIFFDDSRTGAERVIREIIGTALNPVRAVHRLFTGEMWRVSRNRGKKVAPQPYTFTMTIGDRVMKENANGENNTINVAYLNFDFNYGERFTQNGKTKPFEFFKLSLLANMSNNHPSVGDMNILGRIASKQLDLKHDWKMDIGFYQTVKYVDHYGKKMQCTRNFAIISEAVSFGCGVYAEHSGLKSKLSNDFLLNIVALGGTNCDRQPSEPDKYFPSRRYNFGSGFSFRNILEYTLYKHLTVGNDLYFMQLFVMSNNSPQKYAEAKRDCRELNTMGDRSGNTIVYNTAYVNVNIARGLKLNLACTHYFRHSLYKYYPSVIGRSQEYRMGLMVAL